MFWNILQSKKIKELESLYRDDKRKLKYEYENIIRELKLKISMLEEQNNNLEVKIALLEKELETLK